MNYIGGRWTSLSLAAITLFWWIVFVPRANRFFYINTLNVRWLHALNCFDTTHWNHIGLHIVLFHGFNWIVNGFFFFLCPFNVYLSQDLWIEKSIVNGRIFFGLFREKIRYDKRNQVLAEQIALAMATHRHVQNEIEDKTKIKMLNDARFVILFQIFRILSHHFFLHYFWMNKKHIPQNEM